MADHPSDQRWLTEQTNRTEHFQGPVRFVRVRRHIEQNRTTPLFGSCSAGFRTLIPLFGSVRLELEPNSTLVRFVFGKFELLKAKERRKVQRIKNKMKAAGQHVAQSENQAVDSDASMKRKNSNR